MALTDDQLYKLIDNVNSYHRLVSESKGELLLNKYPNAAAAYSLRLLDGYYRDPLVRVRRDGDGAEVDVYADYNNEVSLDSLVTNVADIDDTTTDPDKDADATFLKGLQSLGEFVHDDAYDSVNPAVTATVCVWYDQANENDAKQVVADEQPKIYDSVTGVVTENGKAAMTLDGVDDGFILGTQSVSSFITANAEMSVISVLNQNSASAQNSIFGITDGGTNVQIFPDFNGIIYYDAGNASDNRLNVTSPAGWDNSQHLCFFSSSLTNQQICVDGSQIAQNSSQTTISVSGTGTAYIGRNTNVYFGGNLQSIIIYPSDQSSNRQGIEQDINNHYQIEGYTPPEPLIDLTKRLATEAGDPESEGTPAAAYSLRKLSSSYSDPLGLYDSGPLVRVRRSTDNTEVDVYPDDKGAFSVLSPIEDGENEISDPYNGNSSVGSTTKTKLYEFVYGQACDLTVVVWYDQAGANDATQTSTGDQPKIYDSSTGVITENGKPALNKNASNSGLFDLSASFSPAISDRTVFSVTKSTAAREEIITGQAQWILNVNVSGAGTSLWNGSAYIGGSGGLITTQALRTGYFNATSNSSIWTNGGNEVSGNAGSNTMTSTYTLGGQSSAFRIIQAMQEVILYPSDQSTNRTGIEQNLNDYYNIY